ncbi:MAG: hypothetical protein NTW96_27460 [Planctomycetia bacterium]|nr:hypothetical protein [Planctomycetia bacterium]
MKTLLGVLLAVAVLFGCLGCGAEAVPGGTAYFNMVREDGTKVTFKNNKDTSLESFDADIATGKITLKGLNSNGSNLGNMQMQWSIIESNNRALVIGQLIGAIKELVPLFAGGSGLAIGGSSGGTGTTTAADTDAQKIQRATIQATIANCPFLQAVPDQQAYFAALVAKVPGDQLDKVQAIVDRLKALPAPVAAKVTP